MFNSIKFITSISDTPLTPRLTSDKKQLYDYNKAATKNSDFLIWGSVDSFQKPPVSDYAMTHLYHLQDYNIFHYKEGSFTLRRSYDSFLVAYTYRGKGTLTYGDKTYSLEQGDGFFINCNELHRYAVLGNDWTLGTLHINGPLLPDFHGIFMEQGGPVFHEDTGFSLDSATESPTFQSCLENILLQYSYPQLYRDWYASAAINQLLNHLLHGLTKETTRRKAIPDNIQYLIKYMESNYAQNLTLDFLSDFSSISKYYLSREFKKYTGFTPNNYLITLRIEHAKVLLKNTDLPAAKIAHQVGIHDVNNFTVLFKKRTGMTPIQFRHYG